MLVACASPSLYEKVSLQASPASLCYVLDQETFILAEYWFNPG